MDPAQEIIQAAAEELLLKFAACPLSQQALRAMTAFLHTLTVEEDPRRPGHILLSGSEHHANALREAVRQDGGMGPVPPEVLAALEGAAREQDDIAYACLSAMRNGCPSGRAVGITLRAYAEQRAFLKRRAHLIAEEAGVVGQPQPQPRINRAYVPLEDFTALKSELEKTKADLEKKSKAESRMREVADELLRFVATLPLQDHSIQVQRQREGIVHRALAALRPPLTVSLSADELEKITRAVAIAAFRLPDA